MKKWLIYVLLCASATACDEVDGVYHEIKSGYFVQAYFELGAINTYVHTDNTIWLYENCYDQGHPQYYVLEYDRKKFLELSRKHGDKNFNRWILNDMMPKNEYFANDFAEITITSDAAFDAAHPAGASLNEYVRLITVTPIRFTKSGYKEKCKWSQSYLSIFSKYFRTTMDQSDGYSSWMVTLGRQHIFPVYKLVSELEPDDMALWGRGVINRHISPGQTDPFAVFEFARNPQSPGTHNISIVLRTDTGKTYELGPIATTFR